MFEAIRCAGTDASDNDATRSRGGRLTSKRTGPRSEDTTLVADGGAATDDALVRARQRNAVKSPKSRPSHTAKPRGQKLGKSFGRRSTAPSEKALFPGPFQ
jgi:hypothetical protein